MLNAFTYYTQNYAGIIGWSLDFISVFTGQETVAIIANYS